MEITAKLNYLRMAPRKVRLVASLIRGKTVLEAERQLKFSTKRAGTALFKLLASAIANASHNFSLQKENLKISKIVVDGGPPLKRIRPRAFGKAFPIRKRTSHITMVLSEIQGGRLRDNLPKAKKAAPVLREDTNAAESQRREPLLRQGAPRLAEEKKEKHLPIERESRISPAKRTTNVIRRVFRRKAI